MPRDEHASLIYQRRNPSAVRGGMRYLPYATADCSGLKAHATCPEFYPPSSSSSTSSTLTSHSTSPDPCLDPCDISSAATLVNSSFDQEKIESPFEGIFEKSANSLSDKKQKSVPRTHNQQKKLDHFMLLIDVACKIMNDVWPQSAIPNVFRLQCGATYGYSPGTRGMSINQFPENPQTSDLVPLKKFIAELLKRSRSTAATFQTALCYLEAIRSKISEIQKVEMEGKGTRGEPVDHAIGRISVAAEYVTVAEEENRKLAKNINKSKLRKPHVYPSFPLPDLPSPLLCPRRTLMGALVLAAKFVQDKCYSNRAWAKLCGLPPREVSRCERALGDALGWRLWVGREELSCFGGLDVKLERTPTSVLIGDLSEDSFLVVPNEKVMSVARSHSWLSPLTREHIPSQRPQPLHPAATEIIISPVPSLVNSSGSGSSNWPSGNLSPVPSPTPLFVSNETSSIALSKIGITNLMRSESFICEPFSSYEMRKPDEAVFDIRVGGGQEVY